MKTNTIKMHIRSLGTFYIPIALTMLLNLSGCETDDPVREDVPELITKATLTFTPSSGGNDIVVTATDPDGEGVQDIQIDGPINLDANKSYTLRVTLINGLAQPSDAEYNVTEEVEEEADEHMFFFSWTNNVFSDPTGDGNIDNRTDDVNYEDEDVNGLPLGLETSWTTDGVSSGNFRVILKHQPDLKSETSGSNIGETDVDITFNINIQ